MTSLQASDKREKSLAEILVVVVLVAVLMSSFIHYFFKHQEQLAYTGFQSIAQVFSARVNGIHAQWFMDQQPSFVILESNKMQSEGRYTVKVPVNKKGWIDTNNSESLACQKVWHYVMETPLQFMKRPIGAVLVEQNNNELRYCQYSLSSGEYFTYQLQNGKVSEVKRVY